MTVVINPQYAIKTEQWTLAIKSLGNKLLWKPRLWNFLSK